MKPPLMRIIGAAYTETVQDSQEVESVRETPCGTGIVRWRRAMTATIALALLGCSTTGSLPPAPRTVETPMFLYKIGPLDALNVVVWRNPELSGPVTVRPDGYISMPLIGEVRAAGNSPPELAQAIRTALGKLVLDPIVTVVVTGFQVGHAEQIRIVGEAVNPQAVTYRNGMTLLDLMTQVGGITKQADGNGAILIRGTEGGKQYSVRLNDLLRRGDISANVAVIPGDIVMVPQSRF